MIRLLVIAAVALVAYNVLFKSGGLVKNQGVLNVMPVPQVSEHHPPVQSSKVVSHSQLDDVYKNNPNVLPHPQMSNQQGPAGLDTSSQAFSQLDSFPRDQLVAQDLLPTEGGFHESNPTVQGHLMHRNLFESGHHAGLNTQSSTMKIANLQLRSDPTIPRVAVGPWQQSTCEPDLNRRAFEIGMA
jgi:hypothetical protein